MPSAPECYEKIQACPGETVTIIEEECVRADCVVFLNEKGREPRRVENEFVVPQERSSVSVTVSYSSDGGGRCKVCFQPPDGPLACACFEQFDDQGTDTIEKRIVCGDES